MRMKTIGQRIFLPFATIGGLVFAQMPCAGATYDNLPSGTPKGYVEFYPQGAAALGGVLLQQKTWDVWKIGNGESRRVTGMLLYASQHRRIAERPGKYTYAVTLDQAVQKVTVEVKDGFVTPVRVVIEKLGSHFKWPTLTKGAGVMYDFRLSVHVEKPIPARE